MRSFLWAAGLLFFFLNGPLGYPFAQSASAQPSFTIKGRVLESVTDDPIIGASVRIEKLKLGVVTDSTGNFSIDVSSNENYDLLITSVGFAAIRVKGNALAPITFRMARAAGTLPKVTIRDSRTRTSGLQKIDPRIALLATNPSGQFESVLRGLGAVSNNELSSQYSVRGGNFDENLIYVNDIEIYRPQLVRSGQQEGLSFINPELVGSIEFSNGGFQPRFGDKLSSALDVRYRRPVDFKASAEASLLGGTVHLEGTGAEQRFTYLVGARYRRNGYLLNSLESKGQYTPSFGDVQALLTFDLQPGTSLTFLGNLATNRYLVIPIEQETTFGTVNETKRLRVFFEGREQLYYTTGMGAVQFKHFFNSKTETRVTVSLFATQEDERFDVVGAYFLNEVDNQLGSETFGEDVSNLGVGAYQNYARNKLTGRVGYAEWRLMRYTKKHALAGGVRFQIEDFQDKLYEWRLIDSNGFSQPQPGYFNKDTVVNLYELIQSQGTVATRRIQGFFQDSWIINNRRDAVITGGFRFNYSSLNGQFLFSPRIQASMNAGDSSDVVLRFAAGHYAQPPLFREMRDLFGNLNTRIRAQQSLHFNAAADRYFSAFGRPFKATVEAYYKPMWDVVPYEVDNVRIRYYAQNLAKAYATGLDFRVNGEFVSTLQSWASLGLLFTGEDLEGDSSMVLQDGVEVKQAVGYIRRPTDQRVTATIFFQDYLPKYPTFKVNMTVVFGTGFPFGPPDYNRYRDVLKMPPYRRVDIGFGKSFIGDHNRDKVRGGWKRFENLSASLEVFNMLGLFNTVSYLWVRDQNAALYAIPQNLTGRLINLRLRAEI